MANLSIYSYKSYRAFLSDWLKEKGFTYRSFASRYREIVSLIALAKLLSKGRGSQEKAGYRMSPEALARLGRAIHLDPEELKHLVLLRLENDAEILPGQYGNAYQIVLSQLLEDNKRKKAIKGKNRSTGEASKYTESARLLAETIELLPSRFRMRLLEEAVLQGKIYAARQSGKAGVKALQSRLDELSQLKALGAP